MRGCSRINEVKLNKTMVWPNLKACFRRLLSRFFQSSSKTAGEISPATPVSPKEPLVRYVTHEDRINWKHGFVKERQFHPDKRNELSTFRVRSLDNAEVTALGESEVARKRVPPASLLGWARFCASLVGQAHSDLFIDLRDDPTDPMHPRHAAIKGWPADEDAAVRTARIKAIAMIFSNNAKLELSEVGRQIAARKRS